MRMHLVIAVAVVIVVSCGTGGSPPGGQRPTSSLPPGSTAPLPPSSGPTPGVSVAMPSPGASVGEAVHVIANVALREKPAAASEGAGTIPAGTNAWIGGASIEGGETWLQLVPLDPGPSSWTSGWVSQSDGSPALTPFELGCDSIGLSTSLLAGLSPGDRLACYADPFSFAARIVDCNCDMDGGFVEPEWLGNILVTGPAGEPVTALLVDESETGPPSNTADWLILHVDPSGTAPDPLPFGEVVEVTGQFDHPAAPLCVAPEGVEMAPPDPVLYCRTNLAVSAIEPPD